MQSKLRLYKSLIVLHSFIFAFCIENKWCTGLLDSFPRFGFCSIQFTSIVWIFFIFICFPGIFLIFFFFISPFWVYWLLYRCVIYDSISVSDDLALYQNNHSNNNNSTQTNCVYFAIRLHF